VSKLFIDLGIKLCMPEEGPKRMCPKCETLHKTEDECPEKEEDGNFHKEQPLASEETAELLNVEQKVAEKLLGRSGWNGEDNE